MSNTANSTAAGDRGQTGRGTGRLASVVLWVLQAALAFQFASGGFLKLAGAPELVDLFTDIGAGQWLRYAVGALEVSGAAGLLVPMLSGLAALGLAALMAGAAVVNQFILGESPWLPVALLVVAALIAWGRRARTADLTGRFRR